MSALYGNMNAVLMLIIVSTIHLKGKNQLLDPELLQ